MDQKRVVTVLELAIFRGAKPKDDGSMTGGEIERVGLPFFGGCVRCHASIAAYNAAPTTTGYIACSSGCADDIGFETEDAANRALFQEEYEWGGVTEATEESDGESE